MRSLLLFLACLVPLTLLLWRLSGGEERAPRLPAEAPVAKEDAILSGSDFADPYGETPFGGEVRRLSDVVLRVMKDGYVQYYLRLGALARREGGPVIEGVSCAVFDPPQGGLPRLRMVFEAPRVTGDPAALLREARDAPRELSLEGGVVARDAGGRPLIRVERLTLDLAVNRAYSHDAVTIRLPEKDAVITGEGIVADLELRTARLVSKVEARVPVGDGLARLSCEGSAVVRESEEGARIEVTLGGGARIAHPLGSASCETLRAELRRHEEGHRLESIRLDGSVVLDLETGAAAGLETIRAPRVVIEGRRRVLFESGLAAQWRGRIAVLGLGDRLLDVRAGSAELLLRETADGVELEEARFRDGFHASDREGSGGAAARSLAYQADGRRLTLAGEVQASTPEGRLDADRLEIESPAPDRFALAVTGLGRLDYAADGKLDALGEAVRGTLHLTAGGPLRARGEKQAIAFEATGGVAAWIDEQARVEADELGVELEKGELRAVRAARSVFVRGREVEIRGDALTFADGRTEVTGGPADVSLPGGRLVRARRILYGEDRSFEARDDVEIRARLQKTQAEGVWTVRCDEARGTLGDKEEPQEVQAQGSIVAVGPRGERAEGSSFRYQAGSGLALLEGEPALVRRGEDLALQARRIDLVLEKGELREARTVGSAEVDFLPAPGEGEGRAFSRWHVVLAGSASFRGDRLLVPEGAGVEAFDEKGRLALRARVGAVVVRLATRQGRLEAEELVGSAGVDVESLGDREARVVGERLRFVVGSREVDLFGNARVEAEGWPSEVRFQRLVFTLTPEGIDLRRATEIEVRDREQ